MSAAVLSDYPPPSYLHHILGKLPAPVQPETGLPLWDKGIRLFGNQKELIESPLRLTQGNGGWRAGKSFAPAVKIFADANWRRRQGRLDDLWWLVGPTYDLCQEEMRHLARLFQMAGIPYEMKTPNNQSWTMTFPDTKQVIETRSSGEASRIASRACRGVVLTEANQQTEEAFINSRARTTEGRGWVMCTGTFEDFGAGNWFRRHAEEWAADGAMGRAWPLPSWENELVFPGGRNDPEILLAEQTLSPAIFAEKYGGTLTKNSALVMAYADSRYHVAHRYPELGTSFDPEQPVTLWADPGTAHAYAVFAVQFWRGHRDPKKPWFVGIYDIAWVIDTVYRWGRTSDDIIAECAARPWAKNVSEIVLDFAARQRNANGPAVVEQWAKGWQDRVRQRLSVFTQPVPLAPGYDIHKRALLNSWDPLEAERTYNHDRTRPVVVDPFGPRLMFDPSAAPPLFGGQVDGQFFAGEYNLHKNRKGVAGTILSDDPIDVDNDAIKAISYGLYAHYGPAADRLKHTGVTSTRWQLVTR